MRHSILEALLPHSLIYFTTVLSIVFFINIITYCGVWVTLNTHVCQFVVIYSPWYTWLPPLGLSLLPPFRVFHHKESQTHNLETMSLSHALWNLSEKFWLVYFD